MVVGNQEMALVFSAVAVGVADQGAFPVVVEVVVGDGDEVAGVCDVEKTREGQRCVRDGRRCGGKLPVIVVFVVVLVGRELVVVNPDVCRLLDCYWCRRGQFGALPIHRGHSEDSPIASVGAMTFWIFRPRTITLLTLITRIPILTSAVPTYQHPHTSCESSCWKTH